MRLKRLLVKNRKIKMPTISRVHLSQMLMPLVLTAKYEFFHIRSDQIIGGNILARCSRPLIPISAARHYTSILLSCRLAAIRCSRCRQALFQDRSAALSFTGVRGKDYLISKGRPYRPGILVCTKCQSFPAPERGEMYRYCQPHRGSKNRS